MSGKRSLCSQSPARHRASADEDFLLGAESSVINVYGTFQASATYEPQPFEAQLSSVPIPEKGYPLPLLPSPIHFFTGKAWEPASLSLDLTRLPPYPKISCSSLRDQAALDKSSRRLTGMTPYRKELACFRPLEKCGDALMKAAWLMAIREKMNGEISGAIITKVVSPILRNDTISHLFWGCGGFGMDHVRKGQESTYNNPYREQSTSADLFEAYFGALCSEPGGFDRSAAWLRSMLDSGVFPTLDQTMASMVAAEQVKIDNGPGQCTGKKRQARVAEKREREKKARLGWGDHSIHILTTA